MSAETLTPAKTEAASMSPEVEANRLSFLGRTRGAIAKEMKLTFTLPKPGRGLMYDLGMKGLATANILAMNLWLRGADYMQASGGKNSLPGISNKEFITDVVPTTMTVAGAIAIFIANRNRRPKES